MEKAHTQIEDNDTCSNPKRRCGENSFISNSTSESVKKFIEELKSPEKWKTMQEKRELRNARCREIYKHSEPLGDDSLLKKRKKMQKHKGDVWKN